MNSELKKQRTRERKKTQFAAEAGSGGRRDSAGKERGRVGYVAQCPGP